MTHRRYGDPSHTKLQTSTCSIGLSKVQLHLDNQLKTSAMGQLHSRFPQDVYLPLKELYVSRNGLKENDLNRVQDTERETRCTYVLL